MKSSKTIINEYLHKSDWRVKENSTVSYSIGGLILSNSGNVTSDYWLSEVYDKEIADAHRNADIHLHDLSMLSGYCFTGDTRIKTIKGDTPSFEELVASRSDGIWTYAFDVNKNKIVPAKAVLPRVTRETNEIVEVDLSNGRTVRCTPDHLFMREDGSYIEAEKLNSNIFLKYYGIFPIVVVEVRKIRLVKPIKMYDITVPEYHNFLLEDGVFVHNCAGWSLKQLIQEGLGGVPGRITSAPAKHLSTLCNQMANFLGIMQNEWAGKNVCQRNIG